MNSIFKRQKNIQERRTLRERAVARLRGNMLVRYPELGLICMGVFVMLVGVGAIIPIRSIYAREHGSTLAEIGMMASAFLLGAFVSQVPGGWASDKWGRKPVLVLGIGLSGLILFAFLLSDNPWYFIGLRFVEGVTSGVINPAANAYVVDAVPLKERGAAFGWLGSAFSAGFMMGPAAGGLMVDTLGFTAPFVFGGVLSLLAALLIVVKMPHVKPGTRAAVKGMAGGEVEEHDPAAARRQIPRSLMMPALIGALVLVVGSGFEDGLFISIWSIWLNDLHASNSLIGFTYVIFSLPLMVLMPTTGKLADRYSIALLAAVPSGLTIVAYLVYGFTTNLFLIVTMGLVEGTFVAIMLPALNSWIANLSPDNARGRLQGITSTARTVAGFVSSMLTALLYGAGVMYPFLMLVAVKLVVATVGGLLIWRVERKMRAMNATTERILQTVAVQRPSPALETAAK